MTARLEVVGVEGIPEVVAGDDLAALTVRHVPGLADGDVVVVTSKVVSKAEGRVVHGERTALLPGLLAAEATDVVARRGGTSIVRTRQGPVMANAGIDSSNTEPGTLLLLPEDPDASARRLREDLTRLLGIDVAVVVSDTAGRAWRLGQTDLALGAAGLRVLDDHHGRDDGYGNLLAVTAPAVADEVAALADLATGKTSRCPAAVVRGLAAHVLPAGEHGPGAAALVRPVGQDMFGLGSREAVLRALRREDVAAFGSPAGADEVADVLAGLADGASVRAVAPDRVEVHVPGSRDEPAVVVRLETAAFALGWTVERPSPEAPGTLLLRFAPAGP